MCMQPNRTRMSHIPNRTRAISRSTQITDPMVKKVATAQELLTVTGLSLLAGGAGGFYMGYRKFASEDKKNAVRTVMKMTAAIAVISCVAGVYAVKNAKAD